MNERMGTGALPEIPQTDRGNVSETSTPAATVKLRLGSVSVPNGDSASTPAGSAVAVSPSIDNSEVTNARVEEILLSDIGVSTLLARLKQSIASCREFAGFLKKRANLEEEHSQGLRKLCKLTFESPRRLEGRHGSYLRQFDETTAIHERIADHEMEFSSALLQMHEDLMDLALNMDRGRKQWKMAGLNSEKKVHDALLLLEKSKAKYDQIADEYDRARTGDKRARDFKMGRGFAKTGAQVEEDLQRRVHAADQEYANKVQIANAHRQDLLNNQRPQAIKALKELIFECDSGLTFQLQKFATLNETLFLNNGLSVNPIKKNGNSTTVHSMREVILMIDNETDFKKFVLSMESKLPTQTKAVEIKYEKHPALEPGTQTSLGAVPPSSGVGIPPGPQVGLPGLQREMSNQSHHQHGYGAVVITQADIPHYVPYQQPSPPPQPQLVRTKPVFGETLDTLLERDGSAVPMVVYQCIQAVDLYGLDVEGIYRVSGTKPIIERIKNIFDNDSSQVDFRRPEAFFHDVNSVTGVLKQFFRELPEPLLTKELYREFIHASKIDDNILRRDTLHGIINKLPDPNYATFRALVLHLNRVQEHSQYNRMNSGNLAICFGPTLMGSVSGSDLANTGWQVRVVDTVLQNCESIFDPDD